MSATARPDRIRQRLEAELTPCEVVVRDDSHKHIGHPGARDGRGHFSVTVVSPLFEGENAVARHRRVYGALRELMTTDIHALSIEALTPKEKP